MIVLLLDQTGICFFLEVLFFLYSFPYVSVYVLKLHFYADIFFYQLCHVTLSLSNRSEGGMDIHEKDKHIAYLSTSVMYIFSG